jgi:Stage II sporulation protein E (SpoIIE)
MEPFVLFGGTTGDTGGMHQTPLVGLHDQIESLRAQAMSGRTLGSVTDVFVSLLTLIAAAGAFWIWILDRPRKTYLWLTLSFFFSVAPVAVLLIGFFTYAISQGVVNVLTETFAVLALLCWLLFWRQWFQLARNVRFNLFVTTIVLVNILSQFFIFFSPFISGSSALAALAVRGACDTALGLMLFFLLLQSFRKDRTGALVALVPIILLGIGTLSNELIAWFNIRTSFFPLGIQISVKDVAVTLLVLVVGVLVGRRFVSSQVAERLERLSIDQDLEHASELQQRVLIPEPIHSNIFTVETAYHPARTVGGDFFQIIPYPDGSLLIIVGDVSGKGIGAAMLVAVLVGTARTRAESSPNPTQLLACLNDRMIGRAGGHFATCIAAHISPDGTMHIANAGHIPPYRNGVALDLPGAIPLGIIPGTSYDVATIQLDPGDHLTFLTDGVPEARNAAGSLLGFDETASLSSLPPEAIAQAASAYGQDDDITIVSVRFHPPAASSPR